MCSDEEEKMEVLRLLSWVCLHVQDKNRRKKNGIAQRTKLLVRLRVTARKREKEKNGQSVGW